MSKPNEERDIYYIPPNFLTSGRLFGGMIRARNATIRAILPCSGISAVYLNDDGTTEIRPCPFVLLLDSGKLEPFIFLTDDALEFMASEGVTGFVGFAPN